MYPKGESRNNQTWVGNLHEGLPPMGFNLRFSKHFVLRMLPISQLSIQFLGWMSRFYLCITRCGIFSTLHSSLVTGFQALEVNLGSQGGAEVFTQCHAAYNDAGLFCELEAQLPGVDWMDLFSLPLLASRHCWCTRNIVLWCVIDCNSVVCPRNLDGQRCSERIVLMSWGG